MLRMPQAVMIRHQRNTNPNDEGIRTSKELGIIAMVTAMAVIS